VQPVRPLASAGCPPRAEPLVTAPTQEQRAGAHRFIGQERGPLFEVVAPKLFEPAAQLEALLTVWVLDHAIEGGVRTDHDRSHVASPSVGLSTATGVDTATSAKWA